MDKFTGKSHWIGSVMQVYGLRDGKIVLFIVIKRVILQVGVYILSGFWNLEIHEILI